LAQTNHRGIIEDRLADTLGHSSTPLTAWQLNCSVEIGRRSPGNSHKLVALATKQQTITKIALLIK
jgi:hypothetical protein